MYRGEYVGERSWTTRGAMDIGDKAVIQAIADRNKRAARIFVTGEIHESYIGEEATRLLISINDTLYEGKAQGEPLFVETKADTIRMTRFDPRAVWSCFNPDILVDLIKAEAARLSVPVDPWTMDNFDFYQEMIHVLREKNTDAVPIAWKDGELDDYHNAVYLSSLLLFDKPGYLATPVSEYFASPSVAAWMDRVDYRPLTAEEYGEWLILKEEYGRIKGLTNHEMHFVVDLYDRRSLYEE